MKLITIFIFSLFLSSIGNFNCQSLGQTSIVIEANINKEISLIQNADYIIQNFGNAIWKDIDNTPLKILLITDSLEFLFNHNNPSKEFQLYKYDSLLKTKIYVRDRVFPPFLRATFPAVNGQDCIVVGIPSNTNKTDEDWIIMLLHEHFHLYQGENNLYKKNIELLAKNLSNDSKNWMLEYKFPYDDKITNKLFKEITYTLNEAFLSIGNDDFQEKVKQYKIKLVEFKKVLSSNDFDYFTFQIWQEGVATYTESKYLDILNQNSSYIKEMTELNFSLKNKNHLTKYRDFLLKSNLQKEKRNLFYSIGLLQGIVYDKSNPIWKSDYFNAFLIH